MTEEMIALARRAVARRGWRWMPGMLTQDGFRVCRVDADGYKFGYRTDYNYAYAVVGDVLPDLTDPATLGCVLALVRELLDEPTGYMSWYEGDVENHAGWAYIDSTGCTYDAVPTEAEALVIALEYAP